MPLQGDEAPYSHEVARELLQARAERYARVDAQERRILHTVVTFQRSGGLYALPLTGLREIRPLTRWCTVPCLNPAVLGLVYYRGELLSLHELPTFASGKAPSHAPGWMLVAEHDNDRLGLTADDVMDVVEVEVGAVHAVPVTLGDAAEVFAGMTERGLLIVDVARMFENSRFTSAF